MLDTQIKTLAEDCAYTFKGLYKQSDIKEHYTKILIFAPIITSIIFLVYPETSSTQLGRIMAIITLIFSISLLVGNKHPENIVQYRELANEYKKIYDDLYILHTKENVTHEEIKVLSDKKSELNIKTGQYPIGISANIWTRISIKREMNLEWISAL